MENSSRYNNFNYFCIFNFFKLNSDICFISKVLSKVKKRIEKEVSIIELERFYIIVINNRRIIQSKINNDIKVF